VHSLTCFFGESDNFAERVLFVPAKQTVLIDAFISCVGAAQEMHGLHHQVFLARVGNFERFFQMSQDVEVTY